MTLRKNTDYSTEHGAKALTNYKYPMPDNCIRTEYNMKLNVILEAIIGAATIVGTAVLAPILRSRSSRWGATDEEVRLAIPGDMLVPQPQSQLTMGVTVGATATVV